jgi:hypothetical protein
MKNILILVVSIFSMAYLGVMCAYNADYAVNDKGKSLRVEYVNDTTLLLKERTNWFDIRPKFAVWTGAWSGDLTTFVGEHVIVSKSTQYIVFSYSNGSKNVYLR